MTHRAHDKENRGWKTNYPTVSVVGPRIQLRMSSTYVR